MTLMLMSLYLFNLSFFSEMSHSSLGLCLRSGLDMTFLRPIYIFTRIDRSVIGWHLQKGSGMADMWNGKALRNSSMVPA